MTNAKGMLFENASPQHNLFEVIAPDESTHLAIIGLPDILDIFLTKNSGRLSRPLVLHERTWDHLPVIIEYGDPRSKHDGCNLKTFKNWIRYREILEETDYPEPSPGIRPLEDFVRQLTYLITDVIARCH